MTRLLIIFLFISATISVRAQLADSTFLSEEQLKKEKAYTDLDKALKTPEKVIVLDLSGKRLEALPESIGSFKNLQVLKLGYGIDPSTPKRIVRKSKHIGGGILHLDRGTGKYAAYNKLTELPDTLASLSKLQYIDLNNNPFTEVPMILGEIETLQVINMYGCYGLMDNKVQVEELRASLGANCTVYVSLRD